MTYDQQIQRIRHSAAYIMGYALLKSIGHAELSASHATANGFFYDFRTSKTISEFDLSLIEGIMLEIISEKYPFQYAYVRKEEACFLFRKLGQPLKIEILDKISAEFVTIYRIFDYVDLCSGPHVSHTGYCSDFKLLNVSAAHLKNEEVPTLTRIIGTAWENKQKLTVYLGFLTEVSRRDHRTLGLQLELFNFHKWAASALWQPKGVTLKKTLVDFWHKLIFNEDKYVEISNPILYKKDLFECSGHWDHFYEDMFVTRNGKGEVDYVLKPMNCPDTMLFFSSQRRSYRDLPLRVAEGQVLHRKERAGAIHGIMRTRNFIQDDAHIFLSYDQLEEEIDGLLKMIEKVYKIFGLKYEISLSTRPEQFVGDLIQWNQAEDILQKVLSHSLQKFSTDEGGGAFYGPKIDITIRDSLGRSWQCGTIQLDFQLPVRFDLSFTNKDGMEERPIVIHRAVFGSFERFIGIIIEHFGGAFPTWLSPVQVEILPITNQHVDFAKSVKEKLKKERIRVNINQGNESLNSKIRKAETNKIPYILIVGDLEVKTGNVSIRRYGGSRPGVKSIEDLIFEIRTKIEEQTLDVEIKDFAFLAADTSIEKKAY